MHIRTYNALRKIAEDAAGAQSKDSAQGDFQKELERLRKERDEITKKLQDMEEAYHRERAERQALSQARFKDTQLMAQLGNEAQSMRQQLGGSDYAKWSPGKKRVMAWLGKYGESAAYTGFASSLVAAAVAPEGKRLLYGSVALPFGFAAGAMGKWLYDYLDSKTKTTDDIKPKLVTAKGK